MLVYYPRQYTIVSYPILSQVYRREAHSVAPVPVRQDQGTSLQSRDSQHAPRYLGGSAHARGRPGRLLPPVLGQREAVRDAEDDGGSDGRGAGVSVSGAAAGDDEGVVVSAGWLGD